ncbi:MAG TPA: NAD(P)/FAD-dependent oxidoreductase [Thermoleophilaceae bacterium]|nr:NAD(P)/FAD-dependent oxidoreductase [Thermoleophilaceae bacterium]
MDELWDCTVVGGGAAGLSAALVLGRARRHTLLLDAGGQSNRVAEGIGGLLGQDGRPPADFYALGRDELAAYPAVEPRAETATGAKRTDEGFGLALTDGTRVRTRTLLLATGSDYEPPAIPGVADRWGRSVFHCPFCHGWKVRERALGVLDGAASGAERALLLKAWSDDVTLLTGGPAQLDAADMARLDAAGIAVEQRPVAALHGPGAELESIEFEDGSELRCAGLMVPAPMHGRTALADQLGAKLADPNPVFVAALAVDAMYRTTTPGLFAAGDVAGEMPSVANAVAAGSKAAAMVVRELTQPG